ncbi:MAG TPA: cupredoxin domain-containing protein [Candidatus Paceibacterota bacterium]|nr:cupredoxin domain-containing protein [Candidatus Paceibacterota bacterium]
MNKTALTIIIIGFFVALGIFFLGGSNNNNTTGGNMAQEQVQNVEIKDGVQYITVNAKGGYSPRVSNAKAGIPTKLIVRTKDTYDCSLALSVKQANFQKVLSKTGEEVIDLGTPQSGTPIRGVCGMGMYNFVINFE